MSEYRNKKRVLRITEPNAHFDEHDMTIDDKEESQTKLRYNNVRYEEQQALKETQLMSSIPTNMIAPHLKQHDLLTQMLIRFDVNRKRMRGLCYIADDVTSYIQAYVRSHPDDHVINMHGSCMPVTLRVKEAMDQYNTARENATSSISINRVYSMLYCMETEIQMMYQIPKATYSLEIKRAEQYPQDILVHNVTPDVIKLAIEQNQTTHITVDQSFKFSQFAYESEHLDIMLVALAGLVNFNINAELQTLKRLCNVNTQQITLRQECSTEHHSVVYTSTHRIQKDSFIIDDFINVCKHNGLCTLLEQLRQKINV